jgi:predicted transcriptional regulator
MDSRSAFFETLDKFNLSAADISRRSDVDAQVISKYRTGRQKNLRQDTFDKLIDALPDEAKFYYFALRMKSVKKTAELAVA